MRVDLIQIGDYFAYPTQTIHDGNLKIGRVNFIRHDGIVQVDFVDTKAELLEPIELTPSILENNGFSGKMYAICEIDENRKLQFYYHEHRLKLYWVGVDEYNNSSVVTDEIFRCHCHYVHELQHALWLCGIDKEIEL